MRKLKSTRPSVKTIAMDSTGDVIANGDALGEIPSSQTNGEAEVKQRDVTTEESSTEDTSDKKEDIPKKVEKKSANKKSNKGGKKNIGKKRGRFSKSQPKEEENVNGVSESNSTEEEEKEEEKKIEEEQQMNIETDNDTEEKLTEEETSGTENKEDTGPENDTEAEEKVEEEGTDSDNAVEVKKKGKRLSKVSSGKASKKKKTESKVAKKKYVKAPTVRSASSDSQSSVTEKYEVEKILDERKNKKGLIEYRVRWKGYDSSEDTWEPYTQLQCQKLIDEYHDSKKKKESPKPKSKKGRKRTSVKVVDDDEDEDERSSKRAKKASPKGKEKDVYEVEDILEMSFGKYGTTEFLVRWKGFGEDEDTLEPVENLNCPEMIAEFLTVVEKATAKLRKEFPAVASSLNSSPVKAQTSATNKKSKKRRQ